MIGDLRAKTAIEDPPASSFVLPNPKAYNPNPVSRMAKEPVSTLFFPPRNRKNRQFSDSFHSDNSNAKSQHMISHSYPKRFIRFLGIQKNPASHGERFISGMEAFLSISAVVFITRYFLPPEGSVFMVASMGASSVLLFATPGGPFSQPWPLVGGHLISAAVGVTCATMIPDPLIASAVAASITILAMQYLRCIHPPGAATALTAVVGGSAVRELGYWFLLVPVAINVLVILCMAILVSYAFRHWFPARRYPAMPKK
uniref:HPP family protein n=1 Tax=Candidatus Kentrum sp. TC TaxID=2126339 RepID=A0A450Y900_9GAMM|nr:MAG: HPP family protein [Candidatus Kentron sp. TC]VFK39040.1 MAG: HPP family protein [Candidatus Kentron sp. TC]VFK54678.1 MAG: HPP family protein [Candidatus Kentron sp. TC]